MNEKRLNEIVKSTINNFLSEYRSSTCNRAKIVSINENDIKRIISTHSDNGYIVISPCRGGSDFGIDAGNSQVDYDKLANINRKRVNNLNFGDLYKFGLEMCRKYNQDSFLVQAPNENPKYVTQDGSVDFEFSGGKVFNDISQEYFTDLHKNTHKNGDISNRKPTRFSFTEAYVNPKPQCYSERHSRWLNGEVF